MKMTTVTADLDFLPDIHHCRHRNHSLWHTALHHETCV